MKLRRAGKSQEATTLLLDTDGKRHTQICEAESVEQNDIKARVPADLPSFNSKELIF